MGGQRLTPDGSCLRFRLAPGSNSSGDIFDLVAEAYRFADQQFQVVAPGAVIGDRHTQAMLAMPGWENSMRPPNGR